MSKLKFNKQKSFASEEVVLDEVDDGSVSVEIMETLDPTEIPKEPVNVEVKVSAVSEPTVSLASSCQPTAAELQLAQQLTGTPHVFDAASKELFDSLCRQGIAASFGDEGHARGHKWHQFCK